MLPDGNLRNIMKMIEKLNKLCERSKQTPNKVIDRNLYSLIYNKELLQQACCNIKNKLSSNFYFLFSKENTMGIKGSDLLEVLTTFDFWGTSGNETYNSVINKLKEESFQFNNVITRQQDTVSVTNNLFEPFSAGLQHKTIIISLL
jgi:hypothetical protein